MPLWNNSSFNVEFLDICFESYKAYLIVNTNSY